MVRTMEHFMFSSEKNGKIHVRKEREREDIHMQRNKMVKEKREQSKVDMELNLSVS